jgi:tetratricopeptide (TPR) repeat protein
MLLLSAPSNGLTMIRKNISNMHAASFLLLVSLVSGILPAKAGENSSHPANPPAIAQTAATSSAKTKDLGPGGWQSKVSDKNFTDKQNAAKVQTACTAYKKIAQGFLKGRNDEQALSYMDHTINIDPKDPEAYYLRALALTRLKRFEAASDDIDKAIALYPNKVTKETKDCHALRLAVLQKLGQTKKAEEEQKKFAEYLKGAQAPDITPTPQFSERFNNIPPKRWHPNSPLPMINPTKKRPLPQAAPQATPQP